MTAFRAHTLVLMVVVFMSAMSALFIQAIIAYTIQLVGAVKSFNTFFVRFAGDFRYITANLFVMVRLAARFFFFMTAAFLRRTLVLGIFMAIPFWIHVEITS